MRRLVLRRRPAALVAVILLALPLASYGLVEVWPSYAPPPTSTRVVFGDRLCQEPALIDAAGRVYLSLGSAETLLGRDISVDGGHGRVVLSTEGWRPGVAPAEVASFLASKPLELNAPLKTSPSGAPHVPLDLLARLAGWCYTYFPESNTVVIDRLGTETRTARVRVARTHLFQTPSLLSLRLGTLVEGDAVRVLGESKGRLYVRDGAGRLGWVQAGDVAEEPPSVLE
ncbi:MAG: SH3 domain-containing protein, partial [Firmicutes bacterium]|nr:SH3 domain-containing protein [Bacillota bacterium]